MNQLNNQSILNKIINTTSFYWDIIVDYYHLIKLVRFSIFIALVVIAFMLVPQGKEAIIAMLENAHDSEPAQLINFLIFNFILALMCWYYARTLYLFAFKDEATHEGHHDKFKWHFPRWLGVSMIFIPALVVVSTPAIENLLFWCLLASSILFLFFVYYRRDMLKLKKLDKVKLKHNRLANLPRHTKLILIGFLLINWLLLYLFTIFGQPLSITIGATAVVMLALATLVSVGSTITFLGERKGIPLLFIIVMIAVVTSLVSDNHKIREADEKPRFVSEETSIKQHFLEWLPFRQDKNNPDKSIPVIFVATEGGGIRAAYWTAIVLAHLQDNNPKFAEHVYAISGVSGGSLGASVFNALLTQDEHMAKNKTLDNCDDGNDNYFCRSKRILKEDFLAPTVASLMFADAFQRFCFFCNFDDRAQALEESWEIAWNLEWQDAPSAQGVFSQPFQNLWADDEEMKIPQLFLNSTVVETGQRIIATPLNLDKTFANTFHDALAIFSVTNQSMRLSTTALTSARFSYVSPAGTLLRQDQHKGQWIRLVDGGYFENSGSTAISEIISEIQSIKPSLNIKPLVIHISNEPGYPQRENNGTESQASFLGEILTPLKAIFAVRGGKGQQARIALQNLVTSMVNVDCKKENGNNSYMHFCLAPPTDGVQLPLGWMLSTSAQKNMDSQLKNHIKYFNKIDTMLGKGHR